MQLITASEFGDVSLVAEFGLGDVELVATLHLDIVTRVAMQCRGEELLDLFAQPFNVGWFAHGDRVSERLVWLPILRG